MPLWFENNNTRSDRIPPVAPIGARNVGNVVIQRFAPHADHGNTRTFGKRGGMSGGVTGGYMHAIPQAFQRKLYP